MNHQPKLPDIDWYMDKAREHSGIASDGKLSIACGLDRVSSNMWRSRKAIPSEKSMRMLADLAGVDQEHALCDLRRWAAKDPETAKVWERIRALLPPTLPCLIFAALMAFHSTPAEASTNASGLGDYHILYIMYIKTVQKYRAFVMLATVRAVALLALCAQRHWGVQSWKNSDV